MRAKICMWHVKVTKKEMWFVNTWMFVTRDLSPEVFVIHNFIWFRSLKLHFPELFPTITDSKRPETCLRESLASMPFPSRSIIRTLQVIIFDILRRDLLLFFMFIYCCLQWSWWRQSLGQYSFWKISVHLKNRPTKMGHYMVIELVLPHSRSRKKKKYYVVIELVLPQSRTRLMDYRTRYIHVYRMQIFVDCRTAGAEH